MRAITAAAVGTGGIAIADRFPKERQDRPDLKRRHQPPKAEAVNKVAEDEPSAPPPAQATEFTPEADTALPLGAMFSVSLAAEFLRSPATTVPTRNDVQKCVPSGASQRFKSRLA